MYAIKQCLLLYIVCLFLAFFAGGPKAPSLTLIIPEPAKKASIFFQQKPRRTLLLYQIKVKILYFLRQTLAFGTQNSPKFGRGVQRTSFVFVGKVENGFWTVKSPLSLAVARQLPQRGSQEARSCLSLRERWPCAARTERAFLQFLLPFAQPSTAATNAFPRRPKSFGSSRRAIIQTPAKLYRMTPSVTRPVHRP